VEEEEGRRVCSCRWSSANSSSSLRKREK
jgi:hypothetical protein